MNTPEVTEEDELVYYAEMFHTGLRKGLDSNWSSLAHRMTSNLSNDDYVVFLEKLLKSIKGYGLSTDTIYNYLQKFNFPFYDMKTSQHITTEQSNFGLIMNIISKDDAEGIYEWIKYCNGEDS